LRTRNGTKKAAAHIRNSGLRPEILFGSLLTSAHRMRNRFSTKPPCHLLNRLADCPLSQQPFLMLLASKPAPSQIARLILQQNITFEWLRTTQLA